ncbi:hypothetical protein SA2016_0335 [Sinomonas atrocyanea]|uniref:Uncharacterized protein n=1 Tax=Sinomonas atrocyanea TaxID=37927 RepID=A0A126ZWV7_9MICC|nr:hypothetical protein SA2016_0335 [Sinomonas atrocyanea]
MRRQDGVVRAENPGIMRLLKARGTLARRRLPWAAPRARVSQDTPEINLSLSDRKALD